MLVFLVVMRLGEVCWMSWLELQCSEGVEAGGEGWPLELPNADAGSLAFSNSEAGSIDIEYWFSCVDLPVPNSLPSRLTC